MILYRSLWAKLVGAFALVVVVAIGTVAIVSTQATSRQFELYVSQGKQMRAERLAPEFAAYFALNGSWSGVGQWMDQLSDLPPGTRQQGSGLGQGQGRGRGLGTGSGSERLLLADTDGTVIVDSGGTLEGTQLPESDLSLGTIISVAGEPVGILMIPAERTLHETPEADFLQNVNRSLLWAGLVAGSIALILGLVMARQLTAPLRALTQATRRLARGETVTGPGDAAPQVKVRTQDEIGQLGDSFNQMSRSLTQQETLRRNLMADIAHELRTPLSVIRGDLEALLDGVYEPTPEALASLQEESLLLARLVDDLQALAQAEAGQLRLERQPIDLSELLSRVVSSFEVLAASHDQSLTLDIPDQALSVQGDPQRVRQIVANLLSNALRHAPGPGARVVLSAHRTSERMVEIAVVDNGPGIAADDLAHVFDRFWRADGVRTSGSGLGLAIARELVRAHGGRIWAESTPGEGTTFRFTLPCAYGGSL
jgi:two-component system OmpR family sensor kinase/two-component system sensor histidine kinase BaeS